MKYKVGDRVRIKSLDWYNENKAKFGLVPCKGFSFVNSMARYCDSILTIAEKNENCYWVKENAFSWTDEMIEGLVEEEVDLIPKFGEYSDNEPLDVPTMMTEFIKEHGLPCPNGYIFKDENGNVINATKIVLEKKKKEYPKTFEECCKILGFLNVDLCFNADYRSFDSSKEQWKRLGLMNQFYQLLICRDAYWQIAGEELGLGKPWEPENPTKHYIFTIENCGDDIVKNTITSKWRNRIFVFPTEEMQDAFYENFKKEIEICKEFL